MKNWLRRTLVITSGILGVAFMTIGIVYNVLKYNALSRENKDPSQVDVDPSQRLAFAKDRSLYDKDGNLLRLKGVNAGNIMVTEGWMAPYSCGPAYESDGVTPKTDKDGNVEYPELGEEEVYAGIRENPNLNAEQISELTTIFRNNWFSEIDFSIIKNTFGMNAIRLPTYWRNFMTYENGVYALKSETEAFEYFDQFLSYCAQYEIYCIFDLHGAPKTQNGYEHSGIVSRDMLWNDEAAIQATCDIWAFIANHYKESALGEWIVTYDILNEPCGNYKGATNDKCFPVFDRIYKAIRNTGDKHVITIEGCWDYASFIDPKKYGWENIQYEIHLYNWDWLGISDDTYLSGLEATRAGHDYNVPYFVGEFTVFGDSYAKWEKWLGYFDQLGYSWTIWNYKKTVVGWWNDNWGLMNYRLYLDNNTHQQKVNLKTSSFGDLKACFECSNTTNCYLSTAAKNIIKYFGSH